jgi:hypothetical protein
MCFDVRVLERGVSDTHSDIQRCSENSLLRDDAFRGIDDALRGIE